MPIPVVFSNAPLPHSSTISPSTTLSPSDLNKTNHRTNGVKVPSKDQHTIHHSDATNQQRPLPTQQQQPKAPVQLDSKIPPQRITRFVCKQLSTPRRHAFLSLSLSLASRSTPPLLKFRKRVNATIVHGSTAINRQYYRTTMALLVVLLHRLCISRTYPPIGKGRISIRQFTTASINLLHAPPSRNATPTPLRIVSHHRSLPRSFH